MVINERFEFMVWPGPERRMPSVTVEMIHPKTGEILKTRKFSYRKPQWWWKQHGFSFNGRLRVGLNGVNRA